MLGPHNAMNIFPATVSLQSVCIATAVHYSVKVCALTNFVSLAVDTPRLRSFVDGV